MSIIRISSLLIFSLLLTADGHCRGVHSHYEHKKNSAVKIKYITIRKFQESDFKTLSDYLGSKNRRQYFRCTALDDESRRAGTYFIIGFNRSVTCFPKELFAKIYLVTSLKDGAKEFTCKASEKRYAITSEIYCGITSTALDPAKIKAWRVEIVDGNGDILCSEESYMWR
jgi:hypothetical protein